MTLPTKIVTRLKNIGNEVSTKINNRIAAHNSSEEAHSTLLNGYVKKVDKSNHAHGQITADGKVTTTTNNASKVVVTESDGTVKVIEKVPKNNVVHQDISGKLNKNQGSNNVGKFMKVQSSGELEPEEVTVPNIDVRQLKSDGVEIASINGIKLYCNENTTYPNATTSLPGLMSSQDKTKLENISEGADSVSFNRTLNEGDEIGTITINGVPTKIYCNSTHIISDATPQVHGLMSTSDKVKLNGISEGANKTEFNKSLSSGTKIGTLKLDNQSIDLYCITPTVYTGKDGINITDGSKIGHSNSIAPRTTGSLCKIKYDSQGHITEGIPVDADALYAAKDHNHDSTYSAQDHAHDRWVQVEMDDQGRGALYVNKKLKMATFHWSSNATTTYIPSGKTSYNTIPSEYRPKYRISTSINIDPSKPMTLHIKGRGESDKPGQVWVHASTSGQQMISCVLTWVYGI